MCQKRTKRMVTMKSRVFIVLICLFALYACSGQDSSSKPDVPQIEGMVYIPPGEFIMGSEEEDTQGLGKEFGLRSGRFYDDEKPMRKVYLKGFYIDKYEVTNEDYKRFIDATGHPPPKGWKGRNYPPNKAKHPVTGVTWYDADAYCKWAGKRLPTEAEWEKAARGPNGWKYPWGNEYDDKKANLTTGATAPVGSYPEDKSYYGVYDMGGNVMEWVDSWYEPYPGNKAKIKDYGKKFKVLRGGWGSGLGHYIIGRIFARAASRHYYLPGGAGSDAGFRCAKDGPEQQQQKGKDRQ